MRTVARINVTPVKSTALQHPQSVRLDASGPIGDRRLFFVDGSGRRFDGDVDLPLMLIRSALDEDHDRLELRLPGGAVIEGPASADGDPISVTHDGRPVAARLLEGDWTRSLSEHLGRPLQLARLDEPGTLVDEPVTIVSLASVRELGDRGGRRELDATRFRMTFELDGCQAHEEDTWSGGRIAIGEAELTIGAPIPRCVITTIDAETGKHDFPTLKVIAGYRNLTPNGDVPFGCYARVVRPGIVRLGDPVELVAAEEVTAGS